MFWITKKRFSKFLEKLNLKEKSNDKRFDRVHIKLENFRKEFKADLKELRELIHEPIHEQTTRTTRTNVRKKAEELVNKVEIVQEISSMLQSGASVSEMYHTVVEVNKLCKHTCFYKYLKKVREQSIRTSRTTPRTNTAN